MKSWVIPFTIEENPSGNIMTITNAICFPWLGKQRRTLL